MILADYYRNFTIPHLHDVLLSRAPESKSKHAGNVRWRDMLVANCHLSMTLPKEEQKFLAKRIVNEIRNQSPPGCFLQKDPATNLWFDVGYQKAEMKTSQALRETKITLTPQLHEHALDHKTMHKDLMPRLFDVLLDRDSMNNHVGNIQWQALIAQNKDRFETLPNTQKTLMPKSIVLAIWHQHPPGRFLQQIRATQKWHDVGDQLAIDITMQALQHQRTVPMTAAGLEAALSPQTPPATYRGHQLMYSTPIVSPPIQNPFDSSSQDGQFDDADEALFNTSLSIFQHNMRSHNLD